MYHPNEAIPMPPPPTPAPTPQLLLRPQHSNINNSNSATLPAGNNAVPNDSGLRTGSVINLTNSSDVVIGPMTQYQGSVTIYQYMDATVESSNRRNQINADYNTNNNDNKEAHHTSASCIVKNINTWILLSILVTISIGIIVALYFLFTTDFSKINGNEKRAPREILFGNEYEDDTIPNLGNGHLVIDRKQWGATLGAHNSTPIILHHPIPYVIITHIGVQSNPCDTVYNCSIKMRTIQDSAIAEKGLTDLPANFYVSHDGYVYVGRGWNQVNAYTNHSLAICFMGDYIRHIPSDKQFDGVQYLLAYGVARQFLAPDYKLVAHNQTKSTKSPGSHVYRNIIKWPHWYACGIGNHPKCESELN